MQMIWTISVALHHCCRFRHYYRCVKQRTCVSVMSLQTRHNKLDRHELAERFSRAGYRRWLEIQSSCTFYTPKPQPALS